MGIPRMLWDNVLSDADTIVASDVDTGFPVNNLATWRDSDVWKASGANSYEIEIDLNGVQTISGLSLVNHNLNTVGARYKLEGTNSIDSSVPTWTTLVAYQTPGSDLTLAKFFTEGGYNGLLLTVDNDGGAVFSPQIGIMFVGDFLEFERHPTLPTNPYGQEDKGSNQTSQDGYFLGRIIERSMRKFRMQFPYMTPTWMDATWFPFWEDHRNDPVVFIWDYENHADEAWLMWLDTKKSNFPLRNPLHQSVFLSLTGRLEE